MASVSALRKNHLLPASVSFGRDDTPVTSGIWLFSASGMTAWVAPLQKAPMMTGPLSAVISFSAALTDSAGLQAPSPTTRSLGEPRTPPAPVLSLTPRLGHFT